MKVDDTAETRGPAETSDSAPEEQLEPATPFTWVIVVGVVVWLLGAVIMAVTLLDRD